MVRRHCEESGVGFAVNNAFVEGGAGAVELAQLVVDTVEQHPSQPLHFAYEDTDSIEEKISKVACNLYGASEVTYSITARKKIKMAEALGYEKFPFHVRDIVLNAGAEMLVVIAGEIMRMPGLPKEPQALHIDIVNGEIEGLS